MSLKKTRHIVIAGVVLPVLLLALSASTAAAPITFLVSGSSPSDIQATVDAYRAALGALNPNVGGSFGSGRRESNWDGVPDSFSAPNNLPANFFNSNSPRGAVFSTPGTGFQVSATAASGTPVRFGNINASYPNTFQAFSQQRLFTALGSNILDVNFFVAGTNTPAFVSGFGAVFTDVDLANTTSIEFFDLNNNSLGTFFAPTANNGLSFVGVFFNAGERIGRVRITNGNTVLGPNDGGSVDVVVMDDFIYGEPNAATPEPATLLLLSTGLLTGVAALMRRQRNASLNEKG